MGGKDSLMHMGSEGWPDLRDNGGTWRSLMNHIWMTGCIPECTCHQDLLWEKGKEAVWCFGQCSAGIMHPDTKPKRFRNWSRSTTVSLKCWPDLQIFHIFIKLCFFGMFWTKSLIYEAPPCITGLKAFAANIFVSDTTAHLQGSQGGQYKGTNTILNRGS